MKKLLFLLVITSVFNTNTQADEGMWIPMYLGQLNEAEMQAMGMRITAEDIYSINQASLKDAIVIFGGGCTGELVSNEGLLLTNHHCGYGRIQAHSSIENDYLTNGFWAMDKSEELSNPGLSVTFLVRMEEVTNRVLEGLDESMSMEDQSKIIKTNIDSIKVQAIRNTHYKAVVKPFFMGNQYFLFVNEVFTDVRLVGAPPSNIGKFGGDTDNWMWPRHTGDFSVFRIYADKDNKPADYSEDNVPYKPKKHFSISLKGVEEGDFTFIFGYPGTTEEYIPSYNVEMKAKTINPLRIKLREKRIDIFKAAMNKDAGVRIQYSAKESRISNGWKKWIGENRGITRLNVLDKKRANEIAFTNWVNSDPVLKSKYGELLPALEETFKLLTPLSYNSTYIMEAGYGIEIIRYASGFRSLANESKKKETPTEDIEKMVEKLKSSAIGYFKNYQSAIDKQVFIAMISDYYKYVNKEDIPIGITEIINKYKGDFEELANEVFDNSIFATEEKINAFLSKYKKSSYKKIEKDLVYRMVISWSDHYRTNIYPDLENLANQSDSLMKLYMKAQMEMQPKKLFYPDANFTLRVSYGNVDGYNPDDAVNYMHYTTLSGIMAKEDPDIYDYVVEDKLKSLYNEKDYGRYGHEDGSMRVCFIATNHTTGGNSGSPVLDADGNLIGINFDRCWEGTMSDIFYDSRQCRNIALDIRYCLFIIDKFAGAGHLVEEMTLLE
jgi:hypothetical protein